MTKRSFCSPYLSQERIMTVYPKTKPKKQEQKQNKKRKKKKKKKKKNRDNLKYHALKKSIGKFRRNFGIMVIIVKKKSR